MGNYSTRKIFVGKPKIGGALFRAPLGALLPTDASTPLAPEYVPQGYAHADGLERAIKRAFESQSAWGGDEVVRAQKEIGVSVSFTLLQTLDADVNRSVYGDGAVTEDPADATHGNRLTVAFDGAELPRSVWVSDLAHAGRLRRLVFPDSQVTTEDFTQTFTDSAAVGYPVTLTAFRDDATGVFFFDHTDDGQVDA
ncbi:MAG: hypothetical protein FWH11_01235 [Micrococcales bacterium]|nr:hypothetical protein [Micrococcales bacterium]